MRSSLGFSSFAAALVVLAVFTSSPVCAFQVRSVSNPAKKNPVLLGTHHRQRRCTLYGRSARDVTTAFLSTTAAADSGDDVNAAASQRSSSSLLSLQKLPFVTLSSEGTAAKTIAATAATLFAYIINNHYNMGPVMGSSVVALVSAIALGPTRPALQLAALCGSFAGMARSAVVPSSAAALILGLVCSFMTKLFDKQKWLVGKGGRLGFIAQCACTSTFVALRYGIRVVPKSIRSVLESIFGDVVAPAALVDWSVYKTHTLGSVISTLYPMILSTVAGALFMRLWKTYAAKLSMDRIATPTAAVGATGAIAALISPAVAGPAFIGSFVAMSAPSVLPNHKALASASALSAVAWVAMTGMLLGGWGGKMGTVALLGVLMHGILPSGKGYSKDG